MGGCMSVEVTVESEERSKASKSSKSVDSSGGGSAKNSKVVTTKSMDTTSTSTANQLSSSDSGALPPSQSGAASSGGGGALSGGAKKLKLQELKQATGGFSKKNVLGEGSFGQVFKGSLTIAGKPTPVAVKVLNPESSQGMDEWLAEVMLLPSLNHPNLVKLVGYCAEKGEALLVYELCENGSLDDKMFPTKQDEPILTWRERVKAMQGVGGALLHLHQNKIVHRDLKPSNVLLDSENNPKLTDFGMAKQASAGESHMSTRVMGTMGYLDPAYMETGCLREASDVYSFGVILLQLLAGKDALDDRSSKLTDWFAKFLFPTITDPSKWMDKALEGAYPRAGALQVATIAKHCIADQQEDRPDMAHVVEQLSTVPLE